MMSWIAAALLVSALSLKFFPAPFLWLGLAWLIVCAATAKRARSVRTKIVAVNACAVFFVGVAGEAYWFSQAAPDPLPSRDEARNAAGQIVPRTYLDPVLGWAPAPGRVASWRRYYGDTLVFDVGYTIASNGLRVSSTGAGPAPLECVLFFGGSFTFGAGVEDDETMPYRVASQNEGRLRVHNFGYSGYGPHQMLAALLQGIVDRVVDCQPKFVIYQTQPDHVRRAVNKVEWTTASLGPQFRLGPQGMAVYAGSFSASTRQSEQDSPTHPAERMRAWAKVQLRKSYVLSALATRFQTIAAVMEGEDRITPEDVDLFTAIVDRARERVEKRYPGSEFHVLFWDEQDWLSAAMLERLEKKRIRVHRLDEFLPGFRANREQYVLSREDAHPNPRAHEAIAAYVSEMILAGPERSSAPSPPARR